MKLRGREGVGGVRSKGRGREEGGSKGEVRGKGVKRGLKLLHMRGGG